MNNCLKEEDMKIEGIKGQFNHGKNIEATDAQRRLEVSENNKSGKVREEIKISLKKIANLRSNWNSISIEEVKEVVKILQAENLLLANLSAEKREELNQLIAEELINNPILSARLIDLLNRLRG